MGLFADLLFDYDDLFGGDDDILGDYDPSSYTPFDSSINYDDIYSNLSGGDDDVLGDYDPSSYTGFGSDVSGDTSFSIDDIINEMYENAFYSDSDSDPVDLEIDLSQETEDLGTGPLGGQFGPLLRNIFIGSGQGPLGGGVLGGGQGGGGILGAILGLGGQGGGGILGGGGGGEGGLGSLMGGNPLLQFLAMKSLMKDEPKGVVPIGEQAYGQAAPFNSQDYQVTNITPALMPGVGYANMGPPPDVGIPEVPGMMHGGDVRPGDITFAKLEPGEFVIQKPAVDAVGIETLEQINNMGNGGSYYG